MAAQLAPLWQAFREEFEDRTRRFVNEVEGAWEDVRAQMRTLREAFTPEPWPASSAGDLPFLEALFDGQAGRLLHGPLTALKNRWPLLRVLTAIEEYESGLAALARRLPLRVDAPPGEFAAIIDAGRRAGRRMPRLGGRGKARAIPLRDIVLTHFHRRALGRAELDGLMQLLLAQCSLHLLGPWQDCRHSALRPLLGRPRDDDERDVARRLWLDASAAYELEGSRLLADYREWAGASPARLAAAARRRHALTQAKRERQAERRKRYFAYWSRQQRAVHALTGLEQQMASLGARMAAAGLLAVEAAAAEHAGLLRELDQVLQWLADWQAGDRRRPFPPPSARLLSAEDRARDWLRQVTRSAESLLPAALEALVPRRALPGWRDPFRSLEPEKVSRAALERAGRLDALAGFQEAEAAHRGLVREIERAREVVAFGIESSAGAAAGAAALAEESVANALSLLEYQKQSMPDPRPDLERALTRGQAAALLEAHVAFEESRLGVLAYFARERGARRARETLEFFGEKVRAAARRVTRLAKTAAAWGLAKAGWITPLPSLPEPVYERPFLGQVLDVRFDARELPLLYRRLFRLAPVEDSRFLVGRDAGMQGLSNALGRWQDGRRTAVVVLGARGSGKTSLLNCAVSSLLSGLPVTASQFCERIWRVDQLHRFLRGLLHLSEAADLEAALLADRRVVILEELERTFLRTVGGFEAVRAFLRLVEATSQSTLWLLSLNESCYRYLDAAVSLGRTFTHRINAMSVAREHITSAIFQRHNLSGLRLEFAPLAEGDPRISRLRNFLGLERGAQDLFFDGLYAQSEGIFRSAFELWQDCIERVEGGVVYMRQPLDPDYRPLLHELALEDRFTLQAVLQHGGIREEELAEVLGVPLPESRSRIGKLLTLDILEPDPVCPGFRIRPQARRLVRVVLHRSNLS